MSFPTSIDELSNPSPTNTLNSPSHAGQHSAANNAIEALEEKVGIDNSEDVNSLDYKVRNLKVIKDSSEKTTPSDGDMIGILDSASAFVLKKLSFLNLKVAIGSYLNPVGTIRSFGVSTNPATLLGFGTWAAHGTGRVEVAIDAGQTEFDTLAETGGAKTHTLTLSEIPAHTHKIGADGGTDSVSNTGVARYDSGPASGSGVTSDSKGSDGAHNNLQPYIVVYRWIRTA